MQPRTHGEVLRLSDVIRVKAQTRSMAGLDAVAPPEASPIDFRYLFPTGDATRKLLHDPATIKALKALGDAMSEPKSTVEAAKDLPAGADTQIPAAYTYF